MQYKTKQFFAVLIKLSIVVIAFYFIYTKLTKNDNLKLDDFLSFLKENEVFTAKNTLFLIFLSGLNWFFEIIKWQYLVNVIKKISFRNALEQSLGGLTASLITPNRIGDYGAKAIYYTKVYRKKIVLLNLIGNIAQMSITSTFGIIGLFIFINRYKIEINYSSVAKIVAILLALVLLLLIVFGLKQNRFKIKGFSLRRILGFIETISTKTHLLNLVFSLSRYLIFSFQFYYLLILLNVNISYLEAMITITSMYFLASIIPAISIFDVVIKGSVAVFLFSYIRINALSVLSVTTIMWFLNFVMPSVIGSYFVLNFKFPKTETK